MLAGHLPFPAGTAADFKKLEDSESPYNSLDTGANSSKMALKYSKIPAFQRFLTLYASDYISPTALDLITGFLRLEESDRLGSGPRAVSEIKKHDFKEIPWHNMNPKMKAPFYPEPMDIFDDDDSACTSTFEAVVQMANHAKWLSEIPTDEYQEYFANWDYISPKIIRKEIQRDKEMSMNIDRDSTLPLGDLLKRSFT
mgnify:CR=1 FL=1